MHLNVTIKNQPASREEKGHTRITLVPLLHSTNSSGCGGGCWGQQGAEHLGRGDDFTEF